jgi:hypothetical protein
MSNVVTNSEPCHTFEASPFWRKILCEEFKLKELRVETEDYSIIFWRHPCYNFLISTPYRDRLALEWSGLSPKPLDLEKILEKLGSKKFIIKDVGGLVSHHSGSMVDTNLKEAFINCNVCLDDEIESRFQHAARKNFRKAKEEYGFWIEINPEGIFEHFYALYVKTRRRLGLVPYSSKFFKMLFDQKGKDSVVFACYSPEGKLGYLICYQHGQELISGHLAYDFDQRNKRLSDFMFMSAFFWGREHKFTNFRFGADNINQTSLIRSKEKLGGQSNPQIDFDSHKKLIQRDNPNSPIRRILQYLPLPIYSYTSLLTRVYFR